MFRNYELELAASALKDGKGNVALNHLKLLAQMGDSKAQFLLGHIYAYGTGDVGKNDDQAAYWIERAGQSGAIDAASEELAIAESYADGIDGVKQDKAESIKWLRLSAEGGNKEAVSLLVESKSQ